VFNILNSFLMPLTKKSGYLVGAGNPAVSLLETRGFPSPPRDRYGFGWLFWDGSEPNIYR